MKQITVYEASDGVLLRSFEEARRYTEKKYGDYLTKLAHELLRQDKYLLMTEYLDSNTDKFLKLFDLKMDCLIEKDLDNSAPWDDE